MQEFQHGSMIIDIIILTIVGLGAILGFVNGFIKQLASLVGLVGGLLVAKALYTPLAERISPGVIDSMTVAQILSFILIWIIVWLIITWVASLLTRAMKAISLGCLNRWLGLGLGALKYIILVSFLINTIEFFDANNHWIEKAKKEESLLYYPTKKCSEIFFPLAKEITEQYLLNE